MRTLIVTMLVLSAGAWEPLAAQQSAPPAPPANQEQPNPAFAQQQAIILGVWEKMIPTTETVYVQFTATRKYNATTGITKRFNGQARFMRFPDGLIGAMVYLQETDQAGQPIPNKYELVICTGLDIYFVDPQEKVVHHQNMPNNRVGQVPDQGPLSFLFGMKKAEAEQRYQMEVKKVDPAYTYLDIRPKFQRDAQEFVYARLAIFNQAVQTNTLKIPAFMPRQFYWVEPNKNENTWDITVLRQNAPDVVKRTDFQKPQLPQGWRLQKMQQAPPPAQGGSTPPGAPPTAVRN